MTAPKTLVVASGVLLRAEPASERSTLLVEVRPGQKPKIWRAVPNVFVRIHAEIWASEHGISYESEACRLGRAVHEAIAEHLKREPCPDCGAPPSTDPEDGPYQCEGDHS